jgi:hypothetical protein
VTIELEENILGYFFRDSAVMEEVVCDAEHPPLVGANQIREFRKAHRRHFHRRRICHYHHSQNYTQSNIRANAKS